MSQTTKSQHMFTEFVARFLAMHIDRINEVRIINTTCPETEDRYEAARELAREVDLMIVIGGKNSANTGKLADDVPQARASRHTRSSVRTRSSRSGCVASRVVGVTAGASTPDESVQAVVRRLRGIDEEANARRRRARRGEEATIVR